MWLGILIGVSVLLLLILIIRLSFALGIYLRRREIVGKKIKIPPKIQKILRERQSAVVYFSSPMYERGPNRMLPVIKRVSEEYKNTIKYDLFKDKPVASMFNVITAPTTIILDKEGTVVDYFVGFKPFPVIERAIKRALKRDGV